MEQGLIQSAPCVRVRAHVCVHACAYVCVCVCVHVCVTIRKDVYFFRMEERWEWAVILTLHCPPWQLTCHLSLKNKNHPYFIAV